MPTDSPARTIEYGSDAFDRLLEGLSEEARRQKGLRMLFAGASDVQCKEALGALAAETEFNLHQVDLKNLISERPVETRGNLREMFDAASEDAAVLFFMHADAFFDQPAEMEADDDALTPVDYLFERVESYHGVVIVCLRRTSRLERVHRAAPFDVVVEF